MSNTQLDLIERLKQGEVFLPGATHETIRNAGALYARAKAQGWFVHFRQGEKDGAPGLYAWADREPGRRGGITAGLLASAERVS